MAVYDDLSNFTSQYPNRNQNFMQKIKLNSTTGLYEVVYEPYNYMPYTNAPTWTTTPNPHTAGCPPGQVMGPDGVCRVSTNFTGQPTTPDPVTPDPVTPDPVTPDTTTNVFAGGGGGVQPSYYDEQEALYKRISEGEPGTREIRKDKYKTLPGGMNNWTESQLFQFGLDSNYFTGDDRLKMDIPVPGEHRYADYMGAIENYFNKTMIGQVLHKLTDPLSKKQFNNWTNLMVDKGVLEKQEDGSWKILKGPGDNKNSLYAGGYLKPLNEFKEVDYGKEYFPEYTAEPKKIGLEDVPIQSMYDELNSKTNEWWRDTMINAINGEYKYLDDERYENTYPDSMRILGQDYDLGESVSYWSPSSIQTQPDLFTSDGKAVQDYKNDILALAKSWDTEIGKDTFFSHDIGKILTVPDFLPSSDELLQGRVTDSEKEQMKNFYAELAGIPEADWGKYEIRGTPEYKMGRKERPQLFEIGTGKVYSSVIDLSTPTTTASMNWKQVNSIFGDKESTEVTRLVGGIFDKEQHTDRVISSNDGSPGNKNQDGSTKDWGYDADGRFVNTKTGKTAAHGSYDDAIKAIKNGTASSTLLDRFAWGGTANKKNTTGYANKEEYMADQKNKVVYRNNEGEQTVVNTGNYNQKDDNSKGSRRSKIICDYFYRKGLLSEKLWKADEAYGEHLMKTEPLTMNGYHLWAKHYVREMKKESILGKVYFAWAKLWVPHWAKYLAGEKTIRGKILHSIGKPICNVLGKFNRRLKWQQA